jgi:hypothetical protein
MNAAPDASRGAQHVEAIVDLDEARRRIHVICPAERRVVDPVGQAARRLVGPVDLVEPTAAGWLLLFRGVGSLLRCRAVARELRTTLTSLGCRTKIARTA